jgi:hypothetical protein
MYNLTHIYNHNEKINNKRLKLGQNRRDQLRTLFANSSTYIVEILVIFGEKNEHHHHKDKFIMLN